MQTNGASAGNWVNNQAKIKFLSVRGVNGESFYGFSHLDIKTKKIERPKQLI